MKRSFVALFLILLFLSLSTVLTGCGSVGGATGSGKAAPAISGTTMAGQPVSLESYRGKPLVLVFWASW